VIVNGFTVADDLICLSTSQSTHVAWKNEVVSSGH